MNSNEFESKNVYMLSRCGRSKNPCKICFQSVTKRNGIQCQGACQKWAHFNCLGYTPGKIQDIKAGLIIITCPCPDCSSEPKEMLKNPPITCPETNCPANKFPQCESLECPKNKSDGSLSPSLDCECVNPSPATPPIQTTQKALKFRSKPQKPKSANPCKPSNPCLPSPPRSCRDMAAKQSNSCSCTSGGSNNSNMGRGSQYCKCASRQPQVQQCGSFSSDCQLCERESIDHSMTNTLEQMCKTVTNLSEQIQMIIFKMRPK